MCFGTFPYNNNDDDDDDGDDYCDDKNNNKFIHYLVWEILTIFIQLN
jgi:hypothetical protein